MSQQTPYKEQEKSIYDFYERNHPVKVPNYSFNEVLFVLHIKQPKLEQSNNYEKRDKI